MDWGGTVVWEVPGIPGVTFHHDWERLPNGNTMILCRQTINVPSISPRDILELDSAKFSGTGFPLCGGSFGLFQFKIREVDRQIDPAIDEGSQPGIVS